MPVETFGFLDSLNASYPPTSDGLVGGDDHIRGIKSTLKDTFPGVSQALTTAGGAFQAISGTTSAPGYTFAAEPTLGFWRASSGLIKVGGGRLDRTVPVGAVCMFLKPPVGYIGGTAGTAGGEWLELDGGNYYTADYPALAAHLGEVGSTFTLPDLKTLGRFPRSRTASVTAGTTQASQNKSHYHDVAATTGNESQNHTHSVSGTTGNNAVTTHAYTRYVDLYALGTSITGGGGFWYGTQTAQTGGDQDYHTHSFNVTSGSQSAYHTHSFSTTTTYSGGTEARPEAICFYFCIKT